MIDRKPIDWEAARADYEAVGMSQREIANKFGVSHTAVQKRAKAEGWQQDVSSALERKVAARIAGVVSGLPPEKKAAALDAEAGRRAAVVIRHRDEWDGIEAIRTKAISTEDFDAAKLAKISAETLAIKQQGERKAWGLDQAVQPSASASAVVVIPTDPVEAAKAYQRMIG